MTDQTVTLCIEDDNRLPMPFAVVPFSWVRQYQGSTRFRFQVPEENDFSTPVADGQEAVSEGQFAKIIDIFVDIKHLQMPGGQTRALVNLWVKSGAEHLIHHPKVATFPLARARVVAGLN